MMAKDKPTIVILHDNPKWWPMLQKAFSGYDVILEGWMSDEIDLDLTSTPPSNTVFYNRCSPSAHHRGHAQSLDQARLVIHWLHQHKRTVVNGIPSIELENSKAYQYLRARESGIAIPKTIFTSKPTSYLITRHFGKDTPFVIKPDRGGYGLDIKLFHNVAEFEAEKEPLNSFTGLYLIQSYLPAEAGLYRVELVGQKFIYASKTLKCDGFSTNSCPADQAKDRLTLITDFDPDLVVKCEDLFRRTGLENGAPEFIYGSDGVPYMIEVNANTVYATEAEIQQGVPQGWMAVAQYVYDKVTEMQSQTQ